MARPLRVQVPDAIYHLTARGNERSPIFRGDGDRAHFLELVAEIVRQESWGVLSYCLMGNHYHLLVRTPLPNLSRGMRQLNGVYAQAFNRRHRRVGHLFQGRFDSALVQADAHLLGAVRYIVRNPVRAGLCRSPLDWRWSSHRAILGLTPPGFLDRDTLLSHFGPTRAEALAHYRSFCEEESPADATTHPLVHGDDAFAAGILAQTQPASGIPARYFRGPRPTLEALLASARAADLAAARDHGYGVREIARHLGVAPSTVSRRLRRATLGT